MLRNIKRHLHQWVYNSAKPKFSELVVNHALSKKWQIEKIQEKYEVNLSLPSLDHVPDQVRNSLLHAGKINSPDKYLICIPNGSCFSGFSRLPDGRYLPECGTLIQSFLDSDRSRTRFHRNRLNLDGDCYYLNNEYSDNYSHWFRDGLTRLIIALPSLPPDTRFIINDSLPSFKVDSLKALGISSDRLIPVNDNYLLTRCERLWYATQSKDDIWNPQAMHRVRDALMQFYCNANQSRGARIFISRNNTRLKRLENDDELMPVLEKYGYQSVALEKHSLSEQVNLFAGAQSVIGAHGAGLSNMLFSRSAHFIELTDHSRSTLELVYWIWSSILGHRYSMISGPVSRVIVNWFDIRFSIDPAVLEAHLESCLTQDNKVPDPWWIQA